MSEIDKYNKNAPLDANPMSQSPLDYNFEGADDAYELMNNHEGWVIGARGEALLRIPTEAHMISVGKTGSGKGVSTAIPNLLNHEGSVLSVEIGGVTYKETVNYRKHLLEQNIYVIDPFGATQEMSSCINLLDGLDPNSSGFFTDVEHMSHSFMKNAKKFKEESSYWQNATVNLINALIIYVKLSPDVEEHNRNMVYLSDLLTEWPKQSWYDFANKLSTYNGEYKSVLNEAGNIFDGGDRGENVRGLITMIRDTFKSFKDPNIIRISTQSSFSFSDLRRKKCTVYLVVPEIKFYHTHSTWLRLIVEQAFASCPNPGDGGRNFLHNDRILFMLDEFTQLGKLDAVDIEMQTARQKGITIWALFQDIGRLESIYGEKLASSFLGAAAVTQFYDVSDAISTKYVSQRLGKRITLIPSVTHGINDGETEQTNWNKTAQVGSGLSFGENTQVSHSRNWQTRVGVNVGQSTGTADTTGEQKGTGMDTSSKNMLGFNNMSFGNIDPKFASLVKSKQKQYNVSQNTGHQESQQQNVGYNLDESVGGATTNTTGTNFTKIQNESESNAKGGSKGKTKTKVYSVNYTPHIINKLDPSDVEKLLGTEDNQILFIGAKIGSKKRVAHIVEKRVLFYENSMLMSRAIGYFVEELPQFNGMPNTISIPEYDCSLIENSNHQMKRTSVDTNISFKKSFLFSSPTKSSENSKSSKDYSLALQKYQKTISSKQSQRDIEIAQDELYDVVLSASENIDDEASKIEKSIEIANKNVQRENITINKLLDELKDRAKTIKVQQERCIDKRKVYVKFHEALMTYKSEILNHIIDAKTHKQLIDNYIDYLEVILSISKKWEGIYVENKPQSIELSDNSSSFNIENIQKELNDINFPFTHATSTCKIEEYDLKKLDSFNSDEIKVEHPNINSYINKTKIKLGYSEYCGAFEIQKLIKNKAKETKSLSRFIKHYMGQDSLNDLKYYRNEELTRILRRLRDYETDYNKFQDKFSNWVGKGNKINKQNLESIFNWNTQLNQISAEIYSRENELNEFFNNFKLSAHQFDQLNELINNVKMRDYNRLATSNKWSQLSQHKANFV